MKSKALYHCVPVKVGAVPTETVNLPFENMENIMLLLRIRTIKLCKALVATARHLCICFVHPISHSALVACKLIALRKNPQDQ